MKRGEGRHIYFTRETLDRLEAYLNKNFGRHRALSMIVQKAVEEYLEKQNASEVRSTQLHS